MTLHDYKTLLYRQDDSFWVAEVPAILGCYPLMDTREAALAELEDVFRMIEEEYREKKILSLKENPLPADTLVSLV